MRISVRVVYIHIFSRSAERSELLKDIKSEVHSTESLEARSAKSQSDVAANAR